MIKVGIVGGTGYTGVELLRLLAQHPNVTIAAITSRGEADIYVADMTTPMIMYEEWQARGCRTRKL